MAEWAQGTKMTPALMNAKTVYVGAAAPGTAYDGQVWVCTSSNPPLVKVYDDTNTRWMEHHEVRYESVLSGQLPASGVYLNGALAVCYDTQQSGAKLYARANGSWRDMGGTLSRAYPFGDKNTSKVIVGGATSVPDATTINGTTSGATVVIASTSITPTNSGDYICAFIGGMIRPNEAGTSTLIRLFIGTTKVGQASTTTGGTKQIALGSGVVASNTSTNVYADVFFNHSGSTQTTGLGFAVMTVRT